MLFPQTVNILFSFMGRYAKSVVKKSENCYVSIKCRPNDRKISTQLVAVLMGVAFWVLLAQFVSSISFKVFKAIIMILVVVLRASVVVVFPGILTNVFFRTRNDIAIFRQKDRG